jgi:hypothetical protein
MRFPLLPSSLFIMLAATTLGAAEPLPEIPFLNARPDGSFAIDGLTFAAAFYGASWEKSGQGNLHPSDNFPKKEDGKWRLQGTLPLPGSRDGSTPITFSETLHFATPEGQIVQAEYEMNYHDETPSKGAAVDIMVPLNEAAGKTYQIDGKSLTFPAEEKGVHLEEIAEVSSVTLPSAQGIITIRGKFSVHVQDNRLWKQDAYDVRLGFPKTASPSAGSRLSLEITYQPYRCHPISLAAQSNRGFRDEVSGDGKGGWSDQGPQNDLSILKSGPLKAANVDFSILDAAANHGTSCLVLGQTKGGDLLQSATIPVADATPLANLYLLQAAAWTPPASTEMGTITVHYRDGTEKNFPVVAGRDIGDWWGPAPVSNGRIGWLGQNASNTVGLYVARFPLDNKAVDRIDLRSSGKSLWMIAALTGSPDDIQDSSNVPSLMAAGPDWAPNELKLGIAAHGAFDFSALNEVPAGKFGPITITSQGHFAFRDKPEQAVRFWGVNLCFGATNALSNDEADDLADRLAKSGYNTVRLHHFDRELRDPKGNSYDLLPQQLDRLDYLFAALKRRGIYVNIDLYTARRFSKEETAAFGLGDSVPAGEQPNRFKAIVAISDEAFVSWKKFSAALLTHKNPYTGLTWAEDPALIGICPVNENTLTNELRHAPDLLPVYEKHFEHWLETHQDQDKAGLNRDELFNRFLLDTQLVSEARQREFLRSIGVQAPLTGTNYVDAEAQTWLREALDYVDNHVYADHPKFPDGSAWQSPAHFRQKSSTRDSARVPRVIMTSRVFGKPFTVTEYDSVSLNTYRAEGGALMPAYASLQDWDAVYTFAYASSREAVLAPGKFEIFDLTSDPINLLADRVAALLFRRGDIAAARRCLQFRVDLASALAGPKAQWHDFPSSFSFLGLVSRIGSGTQLPPAPFPLAAVVTDIGQKPPAGDSSKVYPADPGLASRLAADGVLPAESVKGEETSFTSDTGQLHLNTAEGTFQSTTPCSESFVLPPSSQLDGTFASVKNGAAFGTVQVLSLDGKPLKESERLLVLHLTDSAYSGMKFGDQDHRILLSNGKLPHLIKRGEATVSLDLDPQFTWQAWALDYDGSRQQEIPLVRQQGRYLLPAQTVTGQHVQLAYEIIRKQP